MTLNDINSPEDVLEFMKMNIRYGWLDDTATEHVETMKNFRTLYRTSSIDDVLKHGLGTCIEQVNLMKMFLDKIGIPSKMFCTRVYESEDFDDEEKDEHMHCFLLYYLDGKVYQIEHPNFAKIGIYEFETEEEAIDEINQYYIDMSGGITRDVTEFSFVPVGLSFKEFNLYINGLDNKKDSSYLVKKIKKQAK